MDTAPHIGGQKENYLALSLMQYKNGQRQDAVMGNIVGVLNRADIDALARWYASQTWPATASETKD